MENLLQEKENEIQKLKQKCEAQENLALIGEKVAFIIHEIKNPLAGISSVAQLLDSKLQPDSKEKEYIKIILKEISRLSYMTKNFLDFTKMSLPILKEVDLIILLENIFSIIGNDFKEKKIQIKKEFSNSIDNIQCDPDQIKQAILNILINAYEVLKTESLVVLNLNQDNEFINISISDNGPGISETNIDKIFNPFFSTKKNGKGLGLCITHHIIKNHGWHLSVISQENQGCSFIIRIPRKD